MLKRIFSCVISLVGFTLGITHFVHFEQIKLSNIHILKAIKFFCVLGSDGQYFKLHIIIKPFFECVRYYNFLKKGIFSVLLVLFTQNYTKKNGFIKLFSFMYGFRLLPLDCNFLFYIEPSNHVNGRRTTRVQGGGHKQTPYASYIEGIIKI